MLTGVVETIGNNLSVEYIKSTLSVSNDSGTQIIRIGSITTDPELSKDIVETIVNQFSSEMMEKLNIQNINVVDYAKINENPVSPNIVKNAIIGAFIGFIISTSYVYLSYLLDNRLRNKNDAEKYLGIPVLAEIPWFEE